MLYIYSFIFRLALSLHLLFKTVSKFIQADNEDAMVLVEGDIPMLIDWHVFSAAKAIMDYMANQRDILNVVCYISI